MNHVNFSSKVSMYRDLDKFDPKDYFNNFPKYEEYDEEKLYDDKFKYDFGSGEKEYINVIYTIYDENSKFDMKQDNLKEKYKKYREEKIEKKCKKYVVAKEELSEKDRKDLEKYCCCEYCSKSWYNPIKYITCRCCVGCISSKFPQQHNINKAREKKIISL